MSGYSRAGFENRDVRVYAGPSKPVSRGREDVAVSQATSAVRSRTRSRRVSAPQGPRSSRREPRPTPADWLRGSKRDPLLDRLESESRVTEFTRALSPSAQCSECTFVWAGPTLPIHAQWGEEKGAAVPARPNRVRRGPLQAFMPTWRSRPRRGRAQPTAGGSQPAGRGRSQHTQDFGGRGCGLRSIDSTSVRRPENPPLAGVNHGPWARLKSAHIYRLSIRYVRIRREAGGSWATRRRSGHSPGCVTYLRLSGRLSWH